MKNSVNTVNGAHTASSVNKVNGLNIKYDENINCYTAKEFVDFVNAGYITDDDGEGWWSDGKVTYEKLPEVNYTGVWPAGVSHVVWRWNSGNVGN